MTMLSTEQTGSCCINFHANSFCDIDCFDRFLSPRYFDGMWHGIGSGERIEYLKPSGHILNV